MSLDGLYGAAIGILTLAVSGWNAYHSQKVRAEILSLRLDMVERISKVEGRVSVLEAQNAFPCTQSARSAFSPIPAERAS
jgi:hypothetical protein